jgi:mannose-6-phosphate isomerase-like protein (cupin superfamily)
MSERERTYDIATDSVMFRPGESFDVSAIAEAQTPWWNRTLCELNGSWVRLGVLQGDYHWHKHDHTDEFFLVLQGHLDIELEGRMICLGRGQAFTVPAGVKHCPHAPVRTVVLMIEKAGVQPLGD